MRVSRRAAASKIWPECTRFQNHMKQKKKKVIVMPTAHTAVGGKPPFAIPTNMTAISILAGDKW